MLTRTLFILFLLAFSGQVFAQTNGKRFPVMLQAENGTNFSFSGTGGMNQPQFSEIDLNEDGKQDVFVFDRVRNTILTYLNTGTKYEFAPQYIAFFPTNLQHWALLRDFNGDGIMDIFTQSTFIGVKGIMVYQGQKDEAGNLSFELVPNFHNDVDLLSYTTSSLELEIYVPNNDIPAIENVDGDGDLDVLSFNVAGSKLSWYKNESIEKGFGLDSLYYRLEDACWGKFLESSISESIELSTSADFCADKKPRLAWGENRHSGSTIMVWDRNGDGDMELLLGDVSSNTIAYLSSDDSGGNNPWLNELDEHFPKGNTPVNMPRFIASYLVDTNNDGKRDLIFAPNASASLNTNMVWRYENVNNDFQLQEKDFLVGEDWLFMKQHSRPKTWEQQPKNLKQLWLRSFPILLRVL